MKKKKNTSENRLRDKREKYNIKRIRAEKKFDGPNSVKEKINSFQKTVDQKIIKSNKFKLDDFLNSFISKKEFKIGLTIKIPENFSLEFNHEKSLDKLTELRLSLIKYPGQKIEIDFINCKKIDFSILFLLKVILDEYLINLKKLDSKLKVFRSNPQIRIIHSKTDNVNLKLLANRIIPNTETKENDFIPVSALNLIKGRKSQRHYAENKKGVAITKIRNFINKDCLNSHHLILNDKGVGYLDGLLSEILNNAEDHSLFDTWYAYGNLFETSKTQSNPDVVGEINLAILNFGYSIFEGFEETKSANIETYAEMERLYKFVKKQSKGKHYTKENLITLYALQEGKSRLNYIEESRGTGTMKFINSFLNLGDYQSKKDNFDPRLIIYSGSTSIKCDNEFKPFDLEGSQYLSLNKNNDLTSPPENSHLNSLKRKFPGTLLVVKIYLNESHLKEKIKYNGN